MRSIAHIRERDGIVQTVETHLLEVKALAESYGEKLNIRHVAGLAGMLHDMGKYTNKFSEYIVAATSNSVVLKPKRGEVDHSTAGGKLLYEWFHTKNISKLKGILAEVVGNAIISHHSYLKDYLSPDLQSDYLKRVRDKVKGLEEYEHSKEAFFNKVMCEQEFHDYVDQAALELETFLTVPSSGSIEMKLMFLTKVIFSMLIDADRTNTRMFEENKPHESAIDTMKLFDTYYKRLTAKVNSFKKAKFATSPINVLRSGMSEQCDQFASNPSGIYTLSIPTGGGKTLASLRYALKHALEYGKKRIVYIVPFTTIIEQNAEEIRKVLQDREHVLEHHSNVIEDIDDNDENQDGMTTTQQKLKLAKDNWDAPIIFTTMVQFLNVFYAKGSRNIRRLHNLCEAVIIFDEVQKVPTPCISLFNHALNFLKDYGQSSLVLCTATQPALHYVEQKLDINTDAEMINHIDDVNAAFKRVKMVDKATDEQFTTDKLAEFIRKLQEEVRSVLIILNTKSVVKELYQQLVEREATSGIEGCFFYHLSTSMCAAHRNAILDKVKAHLSKQEKVICVSTQLIEAGVDVSFDCVVRSLAGLDSIAQAAGRCNRHGKDDIRNVYMIDHEEENLKHLKEIKKGKEITRKMLKMMKRDSSAYGGDILSRQAMERYFADYYLELKTDLNYHIHTLKKNMTELLFESKRDADSNYQAYFNEKEEKLPLFIANSYGTAAEHFTVIDDHTASVIVPYGEGEDIIAKLNGGGSIEDWSRLLRRAQHYMVNLYRYEIDHLDRSGGLESCLDGKVLVLKEGAYSEQFGVDIENDSPMGLLLG
ncbi:CRISPR-associated helicase Cas3' [Paenibacillus sp. 1001270B_150601_E10]|uniref:CRISPR-associated helicase Cas3' n=1 Tax=Paenibacillus sp. 1001270B_150601_E10 TaxID=2787079 RepID=UPI0018A126BC|nr:CRISPR-associated helicase Cas3' [Paenibacillus sp. 1001270B_150601_E10]